MKPSASISFTPAHRLNTSALILAGGGGTRLGGADKALLRWRGRRFVDHQYARLAPQVRAVWINRRRNAAADPTLPGPVLWDRMLDYGPLGGIHAGLTHLASPLRWVRQPPASAGAPLPVHRLSVPEKQLWVSCLSPARWLLTVPCDAPLLPPDLLARLAAPAYGDRNPLLRYVYDGERDQYLFALIHVDLLASLTQYLDAGGRSAAGWYAAQQGTPIDCRERREHFANINTPEQYQALLKHQNAESAIR